MPYLIDGHNLIPKIPGLSLRALDDEELLIGLLQDFCRKQRKPVEVYFDNAPAGQSGARRYGLVKAYFVRQGTTADAAIRRRLAHLGSDAANWSVVSSDAQVQVSARQAHAKVISAEAFSRMMAESARSIVSSTTGKEENLSPDEVAEWLKLFGEDPKAR